MQTVPDWNFSHQLSGRFSLLGIMGVPIEGPPLIPSAPYYRDTGEGAPECPSNVPPDAESSSLIIVDFPRAGNLLNEAIYVA